ncbi:NifB/NifX family molybdenum-iron cluster-binding protein [Vibrio sp. 10N.261.51.F12]|uniref:NifB/NifX family molybdenum-iron cluster-binding protein n=1 Tax=Vibrio sp. 10N.261.51.F12 TaxID=3229679 RepID=UPI00354BAE39
MIYAIPISNGNLSSHFARAKALKIIDDCRETDQIVSLNLDADSCGKKEKWLTVLHHYHVDAVIVRNIGQNMLSALFKDGIGVYSANRQQGITTLHPKQLSLVTEVSYGKRSNRHPKKAPSCHQSSCYQPLSTLNNRLAPRTMSKLKKVLKIESDTK